MCKFSLHYTFFIYRMSKLFPLLLALLCCFSTQAQTTPSAEAVAAVPRDPATGAVHYAVVEAVDGAAKDALYARAKTWVINAYSSPRDVITTEDKDAGIVVCKGFSEETVKLGFMPSKERLYFSVKISVKEGRYKYELTDFYFQSYPTAGNLNPEQVPVEKYLKNAYSASGKPYNLALNFVQPFLARVSTLEVAIKKAMKGGEEW